MIIGIVVAAVVLLAAIGGIIMVLNRDADQPPPVSITPSQPVPPTEQPTDQPTEQPTDEPTTDQPQPTPSETSAPPSGDAVDLGNGISVVPASGWTVEDVKQGSALLSDGKSAFRGQAVQLDGNTNAGQLCDGWHKQVTKQGTNGEFADPKAVDVNAKVSAATCQARFTVSNGQGSQTINLFSLVSVRKSDGITIVATAYFSPNVDTQQLGKDFDVMVNSMLGSQIAG
jgi:hypothetical protein